MTEGKDSKTLLFLKVAAGILLLTYTVYKYFDVSILKRVHLHLGIFILFLILYLLVLCIAALRWQFILKSLYGVHISFRSILSLTYFGQAMALITPSRVGDLGRAIFLKDRLSKKRTFISLLYDKMSEVGMLGLFTLLGISILGLELNISITKNVQLEKALIVGIGGGAVLAVGIFIAGKYLKPLLKEHIMDTTTMCSVLLLSFVVMGATVALFYLIPLSMGSKPPFLAFIAVGVLQATISMIPVTLSGIGLREGASIILFPLIGIDESTALIMTWLGMIGYSIIPAIIGGLAYLRCKGSFV